jgi:hypothetical protein
MCLQILEADLGLACASQPPQHEPPLHRPPRRLSQSQRRFQLLADFVLPRERWAEKVRYLEMLVVRHYRDPVLSPGSFRSKMSQRHTRLVGGFDPSFPPHPPDSLARLLEDVVAVRLELAHHAMVGVDGDLLFLLDLQQGRMLFHDLPQSVVGTAWRKTLDSPDWRTSSSVAARRS